MNAPRAPALLLLLLMVGCAGSAAWLDRWHMDWPGNRAADWNPARLAIGDAQSLFAAHFYRKADAYFHSGMYPSIFDDNRPFQTAHIGADAGATGGKNQGDETDYLGQPRDFIERFSRNFFPSRHTHLDEDGADAHQEGEDHGGEIREMLPWLKLAQELDPQDPLTYTVTAYWLRSRLNRPLEAERVLRDGLRALPRNPAIEFELGRIFLESNKDVERARNVWTRAAEDWRKTEGGKEEPDTFILAQILTHLGKLEEDAGNIPKAIELWEEAAAAAPDRDSIRQRIQELRQTLPSRPPAGSQPP